MDVLFLHRLHFAFTVTFHYLFPQLTMGLALLIVVMKTVGLTRGDERYNQAARFWAKIFAINFILGVVTGIPMEFQFGTNWAEFARRSGGVIGQPLAMEGIFSFFLESTFLGLFLFGEKRLSKWAHWGTAFMVFIGSWISGFFIIVTDAWMQHPVAYHLLPNGTFEVTSFWGLLLNPWAWLQYAHNMCGSVVTAAFVMSAVGAFYVLNKRGADSSQPAMRLDRRRSGWNGLAANAEFGQLFLRVGIIAGLLSCIMQIFPTGDMHGRYVAHNQPAAMAAMEGLFHTQTGAPVVLMGQPDVEQQRIDNPLAVNDVLSYMIYGTTAAEVKGLDQFPRDQWPTTLPLLYYSYHIMAGLGTYFVLLMVVAALLLWRRKLYSSRWILWPILLSFPLPYIANTAGWMTAEIGRQPWLVYGLMRTADGYSKYVSAGNSLFTLLGFMGMYGLLSILWIVLVYRIIETGPGTIAPHPGPLAVEPESAREGVTV
jgi:cytochrome d ubiquinol oxidase subunit I